MMRDPYEFDDDADADLTPLIALKRLRKVNRDEPYVPSHNARASVSGVGKRTRSASKKKDRLSNSEVGVLPVQSCRRIDIEESSGKASCSPKSLQVYSRRKRTPEPEPKLEEIDTKLFQATLAFSRMHDLVFPTGDPDAVTITSSDIERLEPSMFLNDTIVDFYIKYLQRTMSAEERERTYFFNSFFFRKLTEAAALMDEEAQSAAFARLEKWTKEVNIFDRDYVFVPVNQSLHWSLLIICHGNSSSADEMDAATTAILHLDSMSGSHCDIEHCIKEYMFHIYKRRAGSQRSRQMKFIRMEVPQQDNLHDCGLFLLHYVELFLERAFGYSGGHPFPFINRDWFEPSAASAKRNQILRVIHDLYVDARLQQQASSQHDEAEASQPTKSSSSSMWVEDEDLVCL